MKTTTTINDVVASYKPFFKLPAGSEIEVKAFPPRVFLSRGKPWFFIYAIAQDREFHIEPTDVNIPLAEQRKLAEEEDKR